MVFYEIGLCYKYSQIAGVISLSPKLLEEPFTPNDLRLLKSVASQTGLALENSRLPETIAGEAAHASTTI